MPRVARSRPIELAVVGTAAGLLSGLLGVGGGIILVPLLVLWLNWEEPHATATSLGSVAIIATFGAIDFGLSGHIDVPRALLVGIPAVGGVLIGTRVADRLHGDTLLFLFVVVQVAAAGLMILR
jgi:hypothetical protein